MKVLVIGNTTKIDEAKKKFADLENHEVQFSEELTDDTADLLIDLSWEVDPAGRLEFHSKRSEPILVNSVFHSTQEYRQSHSSNKIWGINALNSFIDRGVWELSKTGTSEDESLKELLSQLNIDARFVEDRVGFISPRVVTMIINEAYYTLQEKNASMADIDLAMKLGTNYPKGPFEWANEIGIKDVYRVLKSLYEDTGDERYKICPLLKSEALR